MPRFLQQQRTHFPAFGILLALLLVAFLLGPMEASPYETLFQTSRFLIALGALGLFLSARLYPKARLFPGSLLFFGLSGLVGRLPVEGRVFHGIHEGLLFIPPEFFLLGLLAATEKGSRLPFWPLFLVSSAFLFLPDLVDFQAKTLFQASLGPSLPFTLGAYVLWGGALLSRSPYFQAAQRAKALFYALGIVFFSSGLLSVFLSPQPLYLLLFLLGLALLFLEIFRHEDNEQLPPLLQKITPHFALALIFLLWVLLKLQAFLFTHTDENIYFYMASLLGEGLWPYKDYFFAHPPLHVLIPGLLFAIFGFSLELSSAIAPLACLLSGGFLYAIFKKHIHPLYALLALVFYLFGTEVLKASSNMTGINLSTMFLLMGLYLRMKGRPISGGIILALAPVTGFYTMAGALALLLFAPFLAPPIKAPKNIGKKFQPWLFPLAFLATFLLWNLLFFAMGGHHFLEGVYLYHQKKPFLDQAMQPLFGGDPGFPLSLYHNLKLMLLGLPLRKEFFYHPHLWLSGLFLPVFLAFAFFFLRKAKCADKKGNAPEVPYAKSPSELPSLFSIPTQSALKSLLLLWLMGLALVIEFSMFRELYSFYFALIYPFLAISAAGLFWLILAASGQLGKPRPLSPTPFPLRLLLFIFLLFSLSPFISHRVYSFEAQKTAFPSEVRDIGKINAYNWTPSPVFDEASFLVKALFWKDHRLKGHPEPSYRYYLWSKKNGFSELERIAQYIKDHTQEGDSLTGSSAVAPILALLSGRKLAMNEADTNSKRFRTGLLDEESFWEGACEDGLKVIVSAPRSYFTVQRVAGLPRTRAHFSPPKTFIDRTILYGRDFPIALWFRHSPSCLRDKN